MKKRVKYFFDLRSAKTDVRTECLAGVATFLASAYIIFVNPAILSSTGMDRAALVTVTCLAAALGTLAMGLIARVPLMMAPGMGLNSFFAVSLCKAEGVPWQTALGVVFLSSLLFFGLAVLGVREKIVRSIPRGLRLSVSVGIGFFIAFIGFQQLGIVAKSEETMVHLGSLSMTTGLGLVGFLVMAALEIRSVKGSILIGIGMTALLGVMFGLVHPPESIVTLPASISPLFLKLDILAALRLSLLPAILAFMYVDLFDNVGTLLAVGRRAGMLEPDGSVRNVGTLLRIDSTAAMAGALLGTSTVTSYVESAVGVAQGGRTGLTSVVTAGCFLLAMFFSPLALAVPAFATAPALILVGVYMVRDVQEIHFTDFEEAIPAFLCMLLMPLTYSISYGIMFGFLSHTLLKLLAGKYRELNVTLWVITLLSGLNLAISIKSP